ncbi:MAG: family 43 glycosylhydrolase [Clostridia bacterium]|nr:family 43 glycosylhydrolase [Clostridia bacterium]
MKKNENFVYEAPKDPLGYQNPLPSQRPTPDPCIRYNPLDGYYYGIHTGDKSLTLYRARRMGNVFKGEEARVIYEANEKDGTYGLLWAPELHFLDGCWYIYTSTREYEESLGRKHLICLKARSQDLFDGFVLAAHILPELYAIDPTVYDDEKHGKRYLCASIVIDNCQKLFIQELKGAFTPIGEYRIIAEPIYDWELVYPNDRANWAINEGAYFVEKNGRLFIVYSGNGCWMDDYVFGILELTGDDPLAPDAWLKSDRPFMTKGNGCYGPGHATFFFSPDGKELFMCYHCLEKHNPKCTRMPRYCHVQRVLFDEEDFPHTGGMPLPLGVSYREPQKKA